LQRIIFFSFSKDEQKHFSSDAQFLEVLSKLHFTSPEDCFENKNFLNRKYGDFFKQFWTLSCRSPDFGQKSLSSFIKKSILLVQKKISGKIVFAEKKHECYHFRTSSKKKCFTLGRKLAAGFQNLVQ